MMSERPELQQLLDRIFSSSDKKATLDQFVDRLSQIGEVEKIAFGMTKGRGKRMMPTIIIVVSSADDIGRIERVLHLLSTEYILEEVDVGLVREERYPQDRADLVLWDRSSKSTEV